MGVSEVENSSNAMEDMFRYWWKSYLKWKKSKPVNQKSIIFIWSERHSVMSDSLLPQGL